MTAWICETCGVQFAESSEPPVSCPVCEDERQYVPSKGQQWTTLEELRAAHWQDVRDDHGLLGIGAKPEFAIGQRALVVPSTPAFLWDCTPLLDPELVDRIGPVGGMAIDHPHFQSTMVEWARAFDCPLYLHAADREWAMRPDERIVFWDGDRLEVGEGLTLLRLGGHFPGATVLHWAGGRALLSGDVVTVAADPRWVSFMYSYPNLIPVGPAGVRRIVEGLEPYEFDRVYGGWWGRVVLADGKNAVRRSAERYLSAIDAA